MVVGVLAVQGDFAEHIAMLQRLSVDTREVRTPEDLQHIDRLILPGGESTAISRLLDSTGLRDAITQSSLPIFGTCAGCILLAKTIEDDEHLSPLKMMNIVVRRNAYGTQHQSFDAELSIDGIADPVSASFIRAPQIVFTGEDVEILAMHDDNPVCVRQGNLLATTFHTEICDEPALHKLFLSM